MAGNTAGTVGATNPDGTPAIDDGCSPQKSPAAAASGKRRNRRGARGGSGGGGNDPSSGASLATSSSLSPIWRMSHFLGELHDTSIVGNTGSIALDVSGMALAAPLTGILVADNAASGIRLLLPEPKYEAQSIELYDVRVLGNTLSPAAPLVSVDAVLC
jgi:hypothetical protein